MNICIVGHGPSLRLAKKGSLIDSHDVVIRLKGGSKVLGTEDYGSVCHHLCSSTEVMGTFFDVQASSFWGYPKKGDYSFDNAVRTIMDLGAPVMIPLKLCNHWNQVFRDMGGKHPNVSTGMAAIIISAHYYAPNDVFTGCFDEYDPVTINLAGFDTLMNPKNGFYRNPEIPRSGTGEIFHDWGTENQLLKNIEDAYNVKIQAL